MATGPGVAQVPKKLGAASNYSPQESYGATATNIRIGLDLKLRWELGRDRLTA